MLYEKIPAELRAYTQWVGWRLEDRGSAKPTKVPYQVRNGYPASITDSTHWCTFDEAVEAAKMGHYNGIGFVLTKHDPYAFIDLDDVYEDATALERQKKIFAEFNSYSERSPSRTGLHIIVKGAVERGRRRSSVEVYSDDRYMTMTGDVFNDAPIEERQALLSLLWGQMGTPAAALVHDGTTPERASDEEIYTRAVNAKNAEKFYKLMCGQWEELGYPSQSEADFALIDILAFYTQNREQIIRIFRRSGLAVRPKAQRTDYLNYMVGRSFDRQLPPLDFDGLRTQVEDAIAAATKKQTIKADAAPLEPPTRLEGHFDTGIGKIIAPNATEFPTYEGVPLPDNRTPVQRSRLTYPPGLVGDIATFLYAAAPRQVEEIALAGAIGFMAGICGRAYNISGVGLNQYVMLIAPTGTGKESISSGLDRLIQMIKPRFPDVVRFKGPGEIASPEALHKYLSENPSVYAIVGEVGLKLQEMSSVQASPSQRGLKRLLLHLYNKSGDGKTLDGMIYSDKQKNVSVIEAPAFTIIGESTGKRFYEALDEGMIEDGLVPRFTLIEYDGPRPALNEHHLGIWPSNELADTVANLAAKCYRSVQADQVGASPEAQVLLNEFNVYCDNRINNTNKETLRQLWSRGHMKAMKLAAIVAVGCNWNQPIISEAAAIWSINMVISDITQMVKRFEDGSIGEAENSEWKQNKDFAHVVHEYLMHPYESTAAKYGVSHAMHKQRAIPQSYFSRRLGNMTSFKKDRMGAANAIRRAINVFMDRGDLQEMPKHEIATRFNTHGKCYVVTHPKAFGL